ncbi:YidC/Oxa1 family membrane protein insertase [Deinococcus reticulitermitis]|uniref:YidC/Oxa1 family membrane protein insertase n=1 Tax=Deinococcus reticulitermitis TaxID=856736 RepID=A0A1H6W4T0_9DEIO|nr:membrane protein insertase YidC [Deinococcus reticulitermitis]SEJ12031.1 YidC/Oxa1 family membrane protein insertase [Deinococcus reticulitermitis]
MTKTLLFPLSAVLGAALLSGCATTGPLPTFGKAITPEWIQADFDGKPGTEYIATSNLQDVVFNARGEVIGWYVKSYAGTPFIKKKADGTYDFSALINQKAGIVNMVAGRKAFAVQAAGVLDPAQAAETQPPQLSANLAQNRQDAVFRYVQGGVTVTKTITLHPRNFKVDVRTDVQGGPERVNMLFPGLGKADNPRVQAVPVGGQPASVQGSGTLNVENIQYAALQENPSQIAHALIVRPQAGTQVDVTLTGGPQGLVTASLPAQSNLEVYGGKNELIHLYQSGYMELPGLFKPNFFGQISLFIVKLMESLYKVIPNWGLVIVALTILLRLAMWPLMQAQGRTTARMQVMQPKIKEIQEKYKGKADVESRMAMQQEMQQLYRDYNFNPAGCFSTFLPFPILIALWSTMRNFEFDSGFLWLPDLAIPDPFYILAIIYLVVNLGQLYVMTRKTPDMFKQQAFLYLIFVYFAFTFPAGVTIYIILSTIIGIIQQVIINKQVERETASLGQTVQRAPARPTGKIKTIDAPKK